MEFIILVPMLAFMSFSIFAFNKHNWGKKFFADKWGIFGVISLLLVFAYPLALVFWAMFNIVGYDI